MVGSPHKHILLGSGDSSKMVLHTGTFFNRYFCCGHDDQIS